MKKTTESTSKYNQLENMSVQELLTNINKEDELVPKAVAESIPAIEKAVLAIIKCLSQGGRLFYIGAGTSGRLGIVDASECPPTFGVPHGMVNGIIAGGDSAIRKAVEFAEDSLEQGWLDLQAQNYPKRHCNRNCSVRLYTLCNCCCKKMQRKWDCYWLHCL